MGSHGCMNKSYGIKYGNLIHEVTGGDCTVKTNCELVQWIPASILMISLIEIGHYAIK